MTLVFDEICIDSHDASALGRWWSRVLGWPHDVDDDKVVKNRIHFDFRPDDQQVEVERVIGLGARRVDIGQRDETWVVLADPEGNEFCILAEED